MVKGISRRVILVKSPDPRLFEEAIFIVREEALSDGGVTADQVLQEAQKVAKVYTSRTAPVRQALSKTSGLLCALAGALLATAGWAAWIWL